MELQRASTAELNALTETIIGGAIAVHRVLGPGLLESAYQQCLAYELRKRGLTVEIERPLGLRYEDLSIDYAYWVDLLVCRGPAVVIVELKAVDKILPVHESQLLTYLRLSGCNLGLLINFNVDRLKDGIRRKII